MVYQTLSILHQSFSRRGPDLQGMGRLLGMINLMVLMAVRRIQGGVRPAEHTSVRRGA